jgi:fructose-bisphosphate aldolase class I|tara:strand:+ start:6374 stop:7255 length:882 start_codon:yes stop_codon:yes gene_type:complete
MSDQAKQIASGAGFIAALDQSGGSTPKALGLYGVDASAYGSEEEMFAEVQKMRERIIMSPDFDNKKVIGAILFERTMDEKINGKPVAHYLWEDTGVVPFLKIDKGLEDEAEGVQLMKAMPDLAALLTKAKAAGIFGTKERSVVKSANAAGIAKIVAQQFEVAQAVIAAGLIPIIEPEVDIHAADKAAAEDMLRDVLMTAVAELPAGQQVMLKLTIPETAGQYDDLADHPAVMRVVALSGGYSTDDATARLSKNTKMIASFSRALTEGLQRGMTDADFDNALGVNIDKIYKASV